MWIFYRHKKIAAKLIDKKGSFLATTKITISQNGLREVSKHVDTFILWPGFTNIGEHNKHILIYIDKNCVIIIPNRSFANVDEKNQFYKIAIDFWQSNKIKDDIS